MGIDGSPFIIFCESAEYCLFVSCTNETFSFIRVWQTVAALFVWGEIPRQKGKVHVLAVFPEIAYSWNSQNTPHAQVNK